MYKLIQIKGDTIYKIRNNIEATKIDWGEWNELTQLGVEEILKEDIKNLNDTINSITKI